MLFPEVFGNDTARRDGTAFDNFEGVRDDDGHCCLRKSFETLVPSAKMVSEDLQVGGQSYGTAHLSVPHKPRS